MKKLLAFLFLFVLNISFSQTIDEKYIKENYTKKEHKIEMRDGVKLFTTVYTPKNVSEKNPIIMVRTPYSCAPYGEDKFSARLWYSYWKNYVKENYIIVTQDVRGRWMSEGEFMDVRPFIENKKTRKMLMKQVIHTMQLIG